MKAKYYLMMAASTLLLSNCSQEEALNQVQSGTKTLTATIEGSSRSAVTDGGVFSWTAGDAISVWVGDKYDTYTFDDATTNSFNAPENPGTPQGYAIYPANANHGQGDLNNGGLPTVKMANAYGYGSTNAPMLAKVENGSLAFKHLGGVMRFVVKNVPNSTTSFKFTANKKITGDFDITTENGNNVIQAGDDATADNEVTINYEIGSTQNQMIFYVPLPVGEYGNYTVTVGNNSHTSENVTNTIARGTLLLMPVYTYSDSGLIKDESGSYVAMEGGEQTLATADGEVLIDAAGLSGDTEAVLNLNYTPSADNSTLTISDGRDDDTESSASVATVNVYPQGDEEVETLTINAPTLTVNLASGTYGTVEAKTATETLKIGGGVTIDKLTVNGGNIELNGDATVNNLVIPAGVEMTIDLGENTLTLGTTSGQGIDNNGTLTIKNGKVVRNTLGSTSDYAIVNREGATATLDACEVVGPVFNVGTMTVQNESSLTTDATDRAALICGDDNVDKAWNFTMTGGKIESKQHSAAVLKNNYWELDPQGLAKFDGVTFTGNTYYDIVLCVVNVELTECILTNDKVWLKADGYVSIVNETETKKENLVGCGWDDIFPESTEE